MCLAEHHVPQKDLEPLRADLDSLGWRTQLSAARPTGRSEEGTTGVNKEARGVGSFSAHQQIWPRSIWS